LARLARSHGFETLAYHLDLAGLEADQISKSSRSNPSTRQGTGGQGGEE
jgi:hypothetical protein